MTIVHSYVKLPEDTHPFLQKKKAKWRAKWHHQDGDLLDGERCVFFLIMDPNSGSTWKGLQHVYKIYRYINMYLCLTCLDSCLLTGVDAETTMRTYQVLGKPHSQLKRAPFKREYSGYRYCSSLAPLQPLDSHSWDIQTCTYIHTYILYIYIYIYAI